MEEGAGLGVGAAGDDDGLWEGVVARTEDVPEGAVAVSFSLTFFVSIVVAVPVVVGEGPDAIDVMPSVAWCRGASVVVWSGWDVSVLPSRSFTRGKPKLSNPRLPLRMLVSPDSEVAELGRMAARVTLAKPARQRSCRGESRMVPVSDVFCSVVSVF